MTKLLFNSKVVLVTGAGGGLGREYAMQFAQRGASVVVNDLGGDMKGDGKNSRAADSVVDEIRRFGGAAVANYDSVEDGEKLVQAALDNFGRIDIVINNAGILRDKSFARTSDTDWDLIHRVHLRGSFMVTRAAWPHMKKQNFGRIIMTSSAAGIYGNFGQANYSAAKLGLLGLSNTLSIEGSKNNILCNTIAPTAGSRLTQTVMPQDVVEALRPEFVAPLVLWLCHESCGETGGLYECAAGWIAKLRWQKTEGAVVRAKGQPMTPEDVRDRWKEICDFSQSTNPSSIQEATGRVYEVMQSFQRDDNSGTPTGASGSHSPEKAIGHQLKEAVFEYTERDAILYALGVGVSTVQSGHLKFLFEHAEDFCVLPTFGVIPALAANRDAFMLGVDGLQIDPTQILHGEQYLEIFKPIPPSGKLCSQGKIVDVLDKGRGMVIIVNIETFDESGEKLMLNQFTTFVQNSGGWGGRRTSPHAIEPINPPSRAPDASVSEKTKVDQAAIYRLSGDYNPLHIDPSFAAMGGFEKPIFHGLGTFGFAARHVLREFADNDVRRFKAIKARFTKPVLPGQTIRTEMWRNGERVILRCIVEETGAVCLSGAYMVLHPTSGETQKAGQTKDSKGLKSEAVFEEVGRRIAENPNLARNINATFLWNITVDGKTARKWTMDLTSTPGAIYAGEPSPGGASCALTLSDEHLVALSCGKLTTPQAFLKGKLKVAGDTTLTQKLGPLFRDAAKL